MQKSLDRKLARLREEPGCEEFILADARDADMGFGLGAPGPYLAEAPAHDRPFRTLEEYRESAREITRQGLVDIMLLSANSSEQLAIVEGLFQDSPVTPAARANDTTDIWLGMSGDYKNHPSLPFSTATIEHIQHGRLGATGEPITNLGLYSITFNNDPQLDREALERYRSFRIEAEEKGFRHFLEVFAPNAPNNLEPAMIPQFVGDSIVRCLAGVTRVARPLFLKIPYFGPGSMEQLAAYDPNIIVGILGGPSGTTHDAFRMLWEAKKYGARAALFGRKINYAEDQLAFVKVLRAVADGRVSPEEAVREYHGSLQSAGIRPQRPLEDDLKLTQL